MNKNLARAVATAMTGTALSLGGAPDALAAATTMYNMYRGNFAGLDSVGILPVWIASAIRSTTARTKLVRRATIPPPFRRGLPTTPVAGPMAGSGRPTRKGPATATRPPLLSGSLRSAKPRSAKPSPAPAPADRAGLASGVRRLRPKPHLSVTPAAPYCTGPFSSPAPSPTAPRSRMRTPAASTTSRRMSTPPAAPGVMQP